MAQSVHAYLLVIQHFWRGSVYTYMNYCNARLFSIYQKYSYTTKYQYTDYAIYRLNIQLGDKIGIEMYR